MGSRSALVNTKNALPVGCFRVCLQRDEHLKTLVNYIMKDATSLICVKPLYSSKYFAVKRSPSSQAVSKRFERLV